MKIQFTLFLIQYRAALSPLALLCSCKTVGYLNNDQHSLFMFTERFQLQ